jgi:hypothetical protein
MTNKKINESVIMSTGNKTIKANNKWLGVRKVLSNCSERDLIGLVADLYALSQSNKDFFEARFIKMSKYPLTL